MRVRRLALAGSAVGIVLAALLAGSAPVRGAGTTDVLAGNTWWCARGPVEAEKTSGAAFDGDDATSARCGSGEDWYAAVSLPGTTYANAGRILARGTWQLLWSPNGFPNGPYTTVASGGDASGALTDDSFTFAGVGAYHWLLVTSGRAGFTGPVTVYTWSLYSDGLPVAPSPSPSASSSPDPSVAPSVAPSSAPSASPAPSSSGGLPGVVTVDSFTGGAADDVHLVVFTVLVSSGLGLFGLGVGAMAVWRRG